MNRGTDRKGRKAVPRHGAKGFTLVELMVAMLLGLLVIGGAVSVLIASRQTYQSNEGLNDVQENARIAFEMMARDVRAAGLSGCDNSGRVANVLNNSATAWWANWTNTVVGYDGTLTDPAVGVGTSVGARVAGTDAITLMGVTGSGYSVLTDSEPAATITTNESSPDLQAGDLIVACDPDHAAIMQITGFSGTTITHAASGTPGNCTTDLSYPTVCSSTSSYVFPSNSLLARLTVANWYIGNYQNTDGTTGSSLYRVSISRGAPTLQTEEMVRDITGMSILYHQSGTATLVAASAVTNWAAVDSMQITLTMQSANKRTGVDAKPISRTFTSTITIRNRVI